MSETGDLINLIIIAQPNTYINNKAHNRLALFTRIDFFQAQLRPAFVLTVTEPSNVSDANNESIPSG
jgi:hypothetical protein